MNRRPLLRALSRRLATVSERIDERPVKSWPNILADARERTSSDRKAARPETERISVSNSRLKYQDLKAQVRPGDIIMVSTAVMAIVRLPEAFGLPIVACDAKGVTHEIAMPMITARLGSLIDENSKVLLNGLNADASAVSVSLYKHVGYTLGSLQNDALVLARKLRPLVCDLVLLSQKDSEAVTVCLYDFLRMVQMHENNQLQGLDSIEFPLSISSKPAIITPVYMVAMRMVFDHHSIRDKIRLEFAFSKSDSVVIKSRQQEKLHIDVAALDTSLARTMVPPTFIDYVKDYALDNLSTTNPFSEGTALQIIRSVDLVFKNDNPITQTTALGWANSYGALNQMGPFMDRTANQWFLQPTPHSNAHLEQAFSPDYDRLAHIRTPVEEVVYCIDSKDTTEVDDGISIKQRGNNTILSVHIANPSSSFKDPWSLINAVYKRPTTIYMPHEKKNMLPEVFAKTFSLANDSRALTVDMTIKNETGTLIDVKVRATTLKYVSRLDYGKVQELVEEGKQADLMALFELCKTFKAVREKNNAITEMVLQSNVQPKTDHKLEVYLENPKINSAQLLVSECMLRANSAIASYAFQNKVPCIYRSNDLYFYNDKQAQEFHRSKTVGFEWLAALKTSVESTDPAPHKVAGLDLYTFSTSPLRRAQDILLHLQLEAHLLGEPTPLSKQDLDNMIPWITTSQSIVKSFQKQMDRFWTLKWMQKSSAAIQTVALYAENVSPGLHKVWLPKLKVFANLRSSSPQIRPKFKCTVTRVDAMTDELEVEETPDSKL